ncbi:MULTISPECIES: flippase [Halobacterium]|uniref:flippase n=1 Tax=Halobacterium TaxID=2239 RepID=UPI001962F104|nr:MULTISPECIES: flippase [Halobacterium]MCF2164665.1 flippase [Halobacterium salinarum]MCF2166889.1 flippase [Halobacterium salinarum]QRY22771.1 flippase [Halobacterium sp. GSL-19]WJK64079.1 flippase [Halobacterium salinarum]
MVNSTANEEEEGLTSITRGASLFFIGRVSSNGLKFVLNLILTRGLGSSLYGIYAYATAIISILVILSRFGTGKSLLRYIPSYEGNLEQRNRVAGLAYITGFIGSTIVGGSLYLFAPQISAWTLDNSLFVTALRAFAVVLPFNAIIQLTNAVFRSLEALEYQVLVSDLIEPVVKLLLVGIALLVGYSLIGVIAAIAIGLVLVCGLSFSILYLRTSIRPRLKFGSSREELLDFYNYSIPLTLKDIGSVLYTRVDILMVGFLLAEADVGVYRIVVLVASMLTLPLAAFNQLFPPVASRLYSNDQVSELELVYATITRWILTVVLVPALVAIVYSSELLAVFGSDFRAGAIVLIVFTVGQLTNCAVGPSGFLLMMTDHQYLNLLNQWVLGILNVVLNYFLILEYGISGAAIATAITLTVINLLRVFEVWYTEGLTPYSRQFWKPLVAGGIGGIGIYIAKIFFSGFVLLIVGSTAGLICFAVALLAFGISPRDKTLLRKIVSEKDL